MPKLTFSLILILFVASFANSKEDKAMDIGKVAGGGGGGHPGEAVIEEGESCV